MAKKLEFPSWYDLGHSNKYDRWTEGKNKHSLINVFLLRSSEPDF